MVQSPVVPGGGQNLIEKLQAAQLEAGYSLFIVWLEHLKETSHLTCQAIQFSKLTPSLAKID